MSRIVNAYLALDPIHFPYLRQLTVVEREADLGVDIELELRFYGAAEGTLLVRCGGVRDLVFRQPFTTDMKLHSLNVHDVSGAQLEDVRFEVRDLEEEWLSFSCRTFEAERHDR